VRVMPILNASSLVSLFLGRKRWRPGAWHFNAPRTPSIVCQAICPFVCVSVSLRVSPIGVCVAWRRSLMALSLAWTGRKAMNIVAAYVYIVCRQKH